MAKHSWNLYSKRNLLKAVLVKELGVEKKKSQQDFINNERLSYMSLRKRE